MNNRSNSPPDPKKWGRDPTGETIEENHRAEILQRIFKKKKRKKEKK